jgi:hypothetical protein
MSSASPESYNPLIEGQPHRRFGGIAHTEMQVAGDDWKDFLRELMLPPPGSLGSVGMRFESPSKCRQTLDALNRIFKKMCN